MKNIGILLFIFFVIVPVMIAFGRANAKIRLGYFIAMVLSTCKYTALHLYPLEDWTGTARGFAFTWTDIFCAALVFSLGGIRRYRMNWFPPGISLYFIYFAYCMISFFQAKYQMQAGFEVVKMIWMYLFFVAAYNFMLMYGNFWPIVYGIAGLMLTMSVHSLYQRYLCGIYQIKSFMPHQNSLALYATLFGCLLLGIMLNEKMKQWQYLLMLVGFGCSTFLVYLTLSRGGLAAMGLGIVVTAGLSIVLNGLSKKTIILLSVMGFLGLVAVCAVAPRVMQRIKNAPESSKLTRINLALAARRMANDFTFGVGMNNFAVYSGPDYYYAQEQFELGFTPIRENRLGAIVETTYLLVAAECGWIALGLLLIWYLYYLLLDTVNMFVLRHKPCFGIAVGLFGGVSANYIQSILEWVLKQYSNFYQLMFVFAVIAVMRRSLATKHRPPELREYQG